MRERLVIVFIAIAVGLIITTLLFFLYQQTKTIPQKVSNTLIAGNPTPTPQDSTYLTVEQPQDESLSDKRSIQVKGKTNPDNIIIVSTNQEDIVAAPTRDGKFAVTITIDAGSNTLITRAIAKNGEEKVDVRTITFSTEEF